MCAFDEKCYAAFMTFLVSAFNLVSWNFALVMGT